MSLRVRPWEELAAGGTRGPGQLLERPGGLGVHWETHLCVCLYARVSVPAAKVALWPRVFVCPYASNWGDWDPEAATGQTD